jgi:integrase/recombinase XerD
LTVTNPCDLFENIREIFHGKKYLFETGNHNSYSRCYLWREIKKVGLKILGKNISPHTLRHSFCTNMLLVKNKSLKAVSNFVGHSSTSITADMYIHDQLKVEDVF